MATATRAANYTGNKGGECNNAERLAHALRVGEVCPYCQQPLPARYAIDHIVPQVRGGKKGARNQVAACISCNSSKGAKSLQDFAAYRGDAELVTRVRRAQRRQLPIAAAREIMGL